MLELKNIRKSYIVGDIETKALDDISISFREKEFVAILGKSGSGKTTCLNIIGGLDRYDSGDMTIKGKPTCDFSDRDWDAYRNNSIGFVFQNYNLIMHLGIVANVEMAMTLSGVSASEKRKRAVEVLEKVGLKDHLYKKPNQLSSGQMQRVAIARALVNEPEILLCDEPTGALDTATSVQIMELIKEQSKDRLVIVVTHNPQLAEQFADRIVNFSDGKITGDTNPYEESTADEEFSLKKTSMSFVSALKLSFTNLLAKNGRTVLTALASSIGIIGIAVIISLSSGFKIRVDDFQRKALSQFPVIISQQSARMNREAFSSAHQEYSERGLGRTGAATDVVYLYDPSASMLIHTNRLTDDYMNYLDHIDPAICSNIGYSRNVNMNLLGEADGKIIPVSLGATGINSMNQTSMIGGMGNSGLSSFPTSLDKNAPGYVEKNYDILAGKYPQSPTDLLLLVDDKNCVDPKILKNLGFDTANTDSIKFSDIVGKEFRIITNDNYYEKTDMGTFLPRVDYEAMYNENGNITVRIAGIIRLKKDEEVSLLSNGIVYSDDLAKLVIDSCAQSAILQAQKESDKNIMTLADMDAEAKKQFISYLGGNPTPFLIMIYPVNFEAKDKLLAYLDAYNVGKSDSDTVVYMDLAAVITDMTSNIMGAITVVLIAFAAISLVVSLIMIGIITWTSVIERTKEIGILRALGARKKDITRVFDAETCILGIFAGVLGVIIAYILIIPINIIIESKTHLPNVARLPFIYAVLLLAISTVLTMLGGHIPARMASRKDAVVALKTE
ncbi:MAG: ATP-binding cassette domain-containing protein [Treponema sp.]|nr:ATP-binding cassette domain-containing protein [Treponema sp.]